MKQCLVLVLVFSVLRGHYCSLLLETAETNHQEELKAEASSAVHYRLPSLSAVRADRSILGANDRCLDQTEISKGTIIRTKDSRALGAKFLNETSLGPASRDQCLILCCSHPDCNVAVYEERDGGNCYLFDCGSPEDFRCKFTSHSFYTSAVLRKNNHEDELAQLKLMSTEKTTTEYYTTKATTTTTTTTLQPVTERKCSRYQFECHTSGECIAIYNACDGIPQCADGSDEASELGCPATTATTSTTMRPMTAHPIRNKMLQYNADSSIQGVAWKTNRDRWPNQDDIWLGNNNNHVAASLNNNNADRHPIFGQNGNIIPVVDTDKIVPRPQYVNNNAPPPQMDYVNRFPQPPVVDSYRPQQYYEPPKPSRVDSYDPNAYQPSIYAYNWNSPSQGILQRVQDQQIPPPMVQLPPSRPQQHPFGPQYNPNESNKPGGMTQTPTPVYNQEVKELSTTTMIPSTTLTQVITFSTAPPSAKQYYGNQQVQPDHASIHELRINQAEFKEAKLQRVRQTTGAIWALSLGLCITLILVALVGCRLRSLKWNLKRGRGSLARDEDYLVNGLYL